MIKNNILDVFRNGTKIPVMFEWIWNGVVPLFYRYTYPWFFETIKVKQICINNRFENEQILIDFYLDWEIIKWANESLFLLLINWFCEIALKLFNCLPQFYCPLNLLFAKIL